MVKTCLFLEERALPSGGRVTPADEWGGFSSLGPQELDLQLRIPAALPGTAMSL